MHNYMHALWIFLAGENRQKNMQFIFVKWLETNKDKHNRKEKYM